VPLDDENRGAVWIYKRSGTVWSFSFKIDSPLSAEILSIFGASVTFRGEYAYIGCPTNVGENHIFVYQIGASSASLADNMTSTTENIGYGVAAFGKYVLSPGGDIEGGDGGAVAVFATEGSAAPTAFPTKAPTAATATPSKQPTVEGTGP
jgi:hypothetical protein